MKLSVIETYRPIFRVRTAIRFDVGAFFMRLFAFVGVIGTLTMFTLLGYSAGVAGTVASTIALAQFILSPRISKIIDKQGQFKVTLICSIVCAVGTVCMLANIWLGGPFGLNYPAAVLMGFVPSPQAMARTRWAYLMESGAVEGLEGVSIKTIFSYEGVIDDIAFMIGPAAAIALSSTFFPEAAFVVGLTIYLIGLVLFLGSRNTEPKPGWVPQAGASGEAGEAAGAEQGENPRYARLLESKANLLFACAPIRVFFLLALLEGLFFGILDTATVVFTQELGQPNYATIALFVESLISVFAGMAFGAAKIKWPLSRQVVVFSVVIGVGYGLFALVNGVVSMFVVYIVAAATYAPFIIVVNTAAERCVPSQRLTEALTWVSAGSVLGVALGPSIGGAVVDAFGTIAGYWSVGATCAVLVALALCCWPLFRKYLD